MKEHIGKGCKLQINRNGEDLFYTAIILAITNTHITFKDRENQIFSFRLDDIVQIRQLNEG